MKKKEKMLEFLKLIKDVIDEKSHHFNPNSDECKACESFIICKEFNDMMTAVENSDYDKDIKTDITAFIIFMKGEYLFADAFDVEDILKNDEEYCISNYHKRFDSVIKGFKHYDKLVEILNDNQLNLIRKIIFDVVFKIEEMMNKIMDRNRAESVILINKLRKPQQEEKSYEDMTREELIEELKNKHS